MGLQKKNRLRDRQDFRDIYNQGIRQNSLHLVLRALSASKLESQHLDGVCWGNPSTPLGQFLIEPTRLGVSISQKVSKKAVIRNRIKRQIQSAFRELLPSISPGWKIVIVVRSRAIECKYEHFLRELEQLLKKAKIIDGY